VFTLILYVVIVCEIKNLSFCLINFGGGVSEKIGCSRYSVWQLRAQQETSRVLMLSQLLVVRG